MSRVLVTHADDPIGRRIAKALYHDPEVEQLLLLGSGPSPRAFDGFLADAPEAVLYTRIDLAKHRPVTNFFHSARFREAEIDTIVHVPHHGVDTAPGLRLVGGLPSRTAEARLVLQHALEVRSVRHLIALGSAFVYRLTPGNANRLSEDSALDLDPNVSPEIRSWIDCDMIFHGEVHHERLRVVLLRLPTVVEDGGYVYLNPHLEGPSGPRARALGFDPLCALISDKDVAKAVRSAVHARHAGIYNVAGREALPLSVLGRWTRRPAVPVPGGLLDLAARGARLLGLDAVRSGIDGAHVRYGFTLDTRRAEQDLDFEPGYRIGRERAGDGRVRLETTSTHAAGG